MNEIVKEWGRGYHKSSKIDVMKSIFYKVYPGKYKISIKSKFFVLDKILNKNAGISQVELSSVELIEVTVVNALAGYKHFPCFFFFLYLR